MDCNVSIILDTRRPKANTLYPVKLSIYSVELQLKRLYSTNYDLSEAKFKSIWETDKPRKEHRGTINDLNGIVVRAGDICKELKPFSFAQFEKKYFRNTGDGANVLYQYEQIIERLKSNKNYGTADNYKYSLKSLRDYILHSKGREVTKLLFSEITSDWLQKYENYMVSEKGKAKTTVSMYLRALRAVFNKAIAEKEINAEVYPFGKSQYQPPTVRNTKKALSQKDLRLLFKANPTSEEQIKAKDFWFFSFFCNGMNVKDIALLKYENLESDKFIFYRSKTEETSKTDLRPVTVYLNPFIKAILKKYGNKSTDKGEYIFPILTRSDSELVSYRKIKNFTKFINQHIKRFAVSKKITADISTYWARHSFATTAIRKGQTMEFMMEALSHSNMKTTKGYFAGFEDKERKAFSQKLMSF